MRKSLLFFFLVSALTTIYADDINGSGANQSVILSQNQPPTPGIMVDDPIAEYNTATGSLIITLDAVYYSDYVITIEGYYAAQDYFPTSSVVVIPAYALSEITHIYIDSDDCGAYEGVLEMNAITTTY